MCPCMNRIKLAIEIFYIPFVFEQQIFIKMNGNIFISTISHIDQKQLCSGNRHCILFCQAPIEDGLDIGLVEFLRLELIAQFLQSLCNICSPPHNTIPLPRLQRRQIFVVFPIIQYRPALCKAGGGIFPVSSNRRSLGRHYLS